MLYGELRRSGYGAAVDAAHQTHVVMQDAVDTAAHVAPVTGGAITLIEVFTGQSATRPGQTISDGERIVMGGLLVLGAVFSFGDDIGRRIFQNADEVADVGRGAGRADLPTGGGGIGRTSTAANTELLQQYLNGAGGRWGGSATRQLNHQLATVLEDQGFRITGGAGRAAEEWIPGPGGATTGGTWVDITATNGTQTIRIQTVTTLADGVTPIASEAGAAARIRAAFPNDLLLIVPKRR
jgi:hypothetical protein